jgi:hypothetical protein
MQMILICQYRAQTRFGLISGSPLPRPFGTLSIECLSQALKNYALFPEVSLQKAFA